MLSTGGGGLEGRGGGGLLGIYKLLVIYLHRLQYLTPPPNSYCCYCSCHCPTKSAGRESQRTILLGCLPAAPTASQSRSGPRPPPRFHFYCRLPPSRSAGTAGCYAPPRPAAVAASAPCPAYPLAHPCYVPTIHPGTCSATSLHCSPPHPHRTPALQTHELPLGGRPLPSATKSQKAVSTGSVEALPRATQLLLYVVAACMHAGHVQV